MQFEQETLGGSISEGGLHRQDVLVARRLSLRNRQERPRIATEVRGGDRAVVSNG